MSMVVTSFNIVCCSKCKVFTHSTIWWNQLNRLGNAFIHKNELKTNEISLVLLWLFFEATLCTGHVWGNFVHRPCLRQLCAQATLPLGYSCGWTWSPCWPCSSPSDIRKATCPGDVAVVWGTFVYSFYFTCYEHKLWNIPHFTVYINSYWIHWLWNFFWLLLLHCGKMI